MTTALDDLVVAYVGNFRPEHSTENHVARAFEHHGAQVVRLQENEALTWEVLGRLDVHLVVWTRTWHLPQFDQVGAVDQLRQRGIPAVGFHLDRWWGLDREVQITAPDPEPFFTLPLLVTADGGHDEQFAEVGIRHRWLPPAVSLVEAQRRGRPTTRWARDVAFVGSWGEYHREWPHRQHLVNWGRTTYGRRFGLYPPAGTAAVRGQELCDLYASVKVLVGDSCLAGGATRYWSDRIPETLGRGGFLVHCDVDGLEEHFTPGEHLLTYPVGDFDALTVTVEKALADPDLRARVSAAGRAHVIEHHTYERRVLQLVELVHAEGGDV